MPKLRAATLLVLAVLPLSACSASVSGGVGPQVISKSDVEQGSKDALAQQVGQTPKSVTCPDDLDAKAGASERCMITADDGSTIGMTVTVKSVDGNGHAEYHIDVDTQLSGTPDSESSPTPES